MELRVKLTMSDSRQKSIKQLIKEAKEKGVCSVCGAVADKFDDDLSYEEYTMSGLCQECQNKLFKEDEEDE